MFGVEGINQTFMELSKNTFKGSIGKVIQGRDILIGIVARIENVLFHIRAW